MLKRQNDDSVVKRVLQLTRKAIEEEDMSSKEHTENSPWARPVTGTIRVAISTIHIWKADILEFTKNPGGRFKAVA